jgi:hypothetical protein
VRNLKNAPHSTTTEARKEISTHLATLDFLGEKVCAFD